MHAPERTVRGFARIPRQASWALGVGMLALGACSTVSSHGYYEHDGPLRQTHKLRPAVPKALPLSASGNAPYTVRGHTYYPLHNGCGYKARGIASWYGRQFYKGRTSNGDSYNMFAMTAASKTLPLPWYVRVTNLDNGRSVIVRVNDRGPFIAHRLIDLSYAAASEIGMLQTGTARVEVVSVEPGCKVRAGYFLQVGSFRKEADAQHLRARLRDEHLGTVSVEPVRVHRETWYAVRLGPFANTRQRDRARRRAAALHLPVLLVHN